jgi:hypothetical protein
MLIAAIAIWLTLVLLIVGLCRIAASADRRDVALGGRYPSYGPTPASRSTLAAGLVVWEEQPTLVLADLRARVPGARGRAGQYAAGS